MKPITLKQPYLAQYKTPQCKTIKSFAPKILQGSIEPINGGDEPDVPWGDPDGLQQFIGL